jgi:hypothetical protein
MPELHQSCAPARPKHLDEQSDRPVVEFSYFSKT